MLQRPLSRQIELVDDFLEFGKIADRVQEWICLNSEKSTVFELDGLPQPSERLSGLPPIRIYFGALIRGPVALLLFELLQQSDGFRFTI